MFGPVKVSCHQGIFHVTYHNLKLQDEDLSNLWILIVIEEMIKLQGWNGLSTILLLKEMFWMSMIKKAL